MTFENYTMMRPLFFDFSDIECREIKDQFMMGNIMVCPVLEANYEDSGDGYGYEKGEYQFTPIKYDGTKVCGINDYEIKIIGS